MYNKKLKEVVGKQQLRRVNRVIENELNQYYQLNSIRSTVDFDSKVKKNISCSFVSECAVNDSTSSSNASNEANLDLSQTTILNNAHYSHVYNQEVVENVNLQTILPLTETVDIK